MEYYICYNGEIERLVVILNPWDRYVFPDEIHIETNKDILFKIKV